MKRPLPAFLLVLLAACGERTGFHRPDYAAEAVAQCDEADAATDPHRALALYGMALDADPRMARAHAGRARVLERTGRADEAERSLGLAVEYALDDQRARHLLTRAQFLRNRARIEPAVRDLDRAINLLAAFPERALEAECRLMRAECRVKLYNYAGAREDLDAADRAGLDGLQKDRARNARVKVDAFLPEKKP
jgi:tetratricopeptide (TPR) repeat protein